MFNKIISSLPFNPSMVDSLGFYVSRLKRERAVRSAGFLLIIIAMLVQTFAFISPPEKSLAASTNHIFDGLSESSSAQTNINKILGAWDSTDIGSIYGYFGVTKSDVTNMAKQHVTISTCGGNQWWQRGDWWTTGRNSLTGYSNVADQYKNSQVAIDYGGGRFIYQRELKAWDIKNPCNQYVALAGKIAQTGADFYILLDCGNFTTAGRYSPPPPPPPPAKCDYPGSGDLDKTDPRCVACDVEGKTNLWKLDPACKAEPPELCPSNPGLIKADPRCGWCDVPGKTNIWKEDNNCKADPTPIVEIRKSIVGLKSSYKPGDTYTYLIEYRNTVNASLANNVVVSDTIDTNSVDVVSVSVPAADKGNGRIELALPSLGYTDYYNKIEIQVKIKDGVASGHTICNDSKISSSNAGNGASKVCNSVIVPCRYDNNIPDNRDKNCAEPAVVCSVTSAVFDNATRKGTFTTDVTSSNKPNTKILGYDYTFGDGKKATNSSVTFTDKIDHTYPAGKYEMSVAVRYRVTGQTSETPKTANCGSAVLFDAPVSQSKTVVNETRNMDAANSLLNKVRSNDVLKYTLTTNNSLNYERKNMTVKDYIGDILDYTDLDMNYLKEQGGTYDEKSKTITWSDVSIPANGSITHNFKVKGKATMPSTNNPSNLGTTYDCKISNVYGNEITMNVDCPMVKGVESLPRTGPGSSMIIMGLITTVIGYFFARSRLMAKELTIIKDDYATSGGY